MASAHNVFSTDRIHTVGLEEMEALKETANRLYSEGKFQQAVIGYSYALKQLVELVLPQQRRTLINLDHAASVSQAIRDCREVPTKGRKLAAVLFCNRAAAQLKLFKFHQAAQDAGAAATIDADNFKAWYRKAMAHKELNQWYECHQACKAASRLEPGNEDLRALYEESQFKMAAPPAPSPMAVPIDTSGRRRRFGIF